MPSRASGWSRIEQLWTRISAATWTLEILAILVGIACLAILTGLLLHADGRPVATWNGVTLNAVISVLATIAKLSATFALGSAIAQSKWVLFWHKPQSLLDFEAIDLASRGASGSLALFLRPRRIAAVGALAFVLSLAFDPFAQQLVGYVNEIAYQQSAKVTAPRVQRYDGGTQWRLLASLFQDGNRSLYDPMVSVADFAMQAAILSGLAPTGQKSLESSHLACPSANCTWPAFETLAVCSACNNVTDRLEKGLTDGYAYTRLATGSGGTAQERIDGYTLPNGLFISNPSYSANRAYLPLRMTTSNTVKPSDTISMKELDTLVWSTAMLKLVVPADSIVRWPDVTVQATECSLFYCVKRYELNITNNRLSQNSQIVDMERAANSWVPTNTTGYAIPPTASDDLGSDIVKSNIDRTDLMLGSGYNVSQKAVYGIAAYLNSTFWKSPMQSIQGAVVKRTNTTTSYLPPAIQALYESTDLNATFENIAASMTNAILMSSGEDLVQTGSTGTSRTTYRIRWSWISLPVAVLALASIQLVTILFRSRDVPLLKSSPLATLSKGRHAAEALDGAESIEAMRQAAERSKVNLFERRLKWGNTTGFPPSEGHPLAQQMYYKGAQQAYHKGAQDHAGGSGASSFVTERLLRD